MKRSNSPVSCVARGLSACLLSAVALWPGALISQQAEYDPEWFDCFEIQRDGSLLHVFESQRYPSRDAYLSCVGKSCVGREQTTAGDGTPAEVFQHVYFPKGGNHYVWTWTLWSKNGKTPESHQTRVVPLRDCFTMIPDAELWTQDMGEPRYEGEEVHATNLIQNYRADYFYAPTRLLGDWSDATAIVFEKKSSGGAYLSGFYEDIYGDIVLKNGAMRAAFEIPEHHTGEWRQFRVPFNDPDWRLQGGATSIADVLENVTVFQIRAEYATGKDTSAIRNVVVE